jgi:hypothetical protein
MGCFLTHGILTAELHKQSGMVDRTLRREINYHWTTDPMTWNTLQKSGQEPKVSPQHHQ